MRTVVNVLRGYDLRAKNRSQFPELSLSDEIDCAEDAAKSVSLLRLIENKILPIAVDIHRTQTHDEELYGLCAELIAFYTHQKEECEYELMGPSSATCAPAAEAAVRGTPAGGDDADGYNCIYEEFEPSQSNARKPDESSDVISDHKEDGAPDTADDNVDPVYARVHKPTTTAQPIDDDSFKETELEEQDVFEAGSCPRISDSESDVSGPELDYEARERSLSVDVTETGFPPTSNENTGNINGCLKPEMSSQNEENDGENEPSVTEDEGDEPNDCPKPKKSKEQLTKKLGRYLRKLKPKKKQKFTPPHDVDDSTASKTYVGFDKCDSGAEMLESQKISEQQRAEKREIVSENRGGSDTSDDSDCYDIAEPIPTRFHDSFNDQQETYEDITSFQRDVTAVVDTDDVTSGMTRDYDMSPYDLEAPCANNKRENVSGIAKQTEHTPNSVKRDLLGSHPPLPPRDSTTLTLYTKKPESDENSREDEADDNLSIGNESNGSLDSFLPNASEWDKMSKTSEDEFIEDMSRGVQNDLEERDDDLESCNSETRDLEPNKSLLDNVSLKSDSDSESTCHGGGDVDPADEIHVDHVTGSNKQLDCDDDETHDTVNELWSPQEISPDYGSEKQAKNKDGKKKGWVNALKKIYEKPHRKLSKVKSKMGRSQSCTNIADDGFPIENPKYTDNLRKATSTMSLTVEKKSRRFPWKRKKSKDIAVLPTSPSFDRLSNLDGDNSSDVIEEDCDDNVTSQVASESSTAGCDSGLSAVNERQSADSGYATNVSKTESPYFPKKSKQAYPWHSKRKAHKL